MERKKLLSIVQNVEGFRELENETLDLSLNYGQFQNSIMGSPENYCIKKVI